MLDARLNLIKSKNIRRPTAYVLALLNDYAGIAYDESKVTALKGHWREQSFGINDSNAPLDLEIGTGNGWFFAHHAEKHPDRLIIGIEKKYKPLILAVRRFLSRGLKNARICRYDAAFLDHIFADQEINHVFVHHPDPWNKRDKQKHRLMRQEFLYKLYLKQRPNSFLDFKTDCKDYFLWAHAEILKTSYVVERYTEDLHKSVWAAENFVTQFEKIYIANGLPIYSFRARKELAQKQ